MRRKGDGRLSVKLALSGDELTDDAVEAGRQRIDRWPWHARLVRTRSAASALATAGYVRINGTRIDAPGRMVRLGDVITVALDQAVQVVKVRGFTERRGPPNHGQELYEELR
jgi:ribosome-associated heat shock protein Hsp15